MSSLIGPKEPSSEQIPSHPNAPSSVKDPLIKDNPLLPSAKSEDKEPSKPITNAKPLPEVRGRQLPNPLAFRDLPAIPHEIDRPLPSLPHVDKPERTWEGYSPLMRAVINNDLNEVKSLIIKKANVNFISLSGETPLHRALIKGDFDVVKFLVDNGASLEIPPGYEKSSASENVAILPRSSPLNIAISEGCDDAILNLLLSKNIDVNSSDKNGWTPLMLAIETGNSRAVLALLQHGADPHQNILGWTALTFAHEKENNCLNVLLSFLKLNSQDIDKPEAAKTGTVNEAPNLEEGLMNAIKADDLELVRAFIDMGADLKSLVDSKQLTSSHLIASKSIELAKILIEGGLDINEISENGSTPLISAIQSGNFEIFKALIDAGANLNQLNSDNKTPIFYTLRDERIKFLNYLVQPDRKANTQEVDINFQDYGGNSPIMEAAYKGQIQIVKRLTDLRADIELVNKTGRTVYMLLDLVQPRNYSEIRDHLNLYSTFSYGGIFNNTKLVAHALQLKGEYKIRGNLISIEGYNPRLIAADLAKSFKEEFESHSIFAETYTAHRLIAEKANSAELISRIRSGLPTLVDSGFINHAIFFVFHGDKLSIIDRSGFIAPDKRGTSLIMGSYNRRKLRRANIQAIHNLKDTSQEQFYEAFKSCLKSIDFEETADQTLRDHLKLPQQVVGNCSRASAEGALRLLIAYQTLLPRENYTPHVDLNSLLETRRDLLNNHLTQYFDGFLLLDQIKKIKSYLALKEHDQSKDFLSEAFLMLSKNISDTRKSIEKLDKANPLYAASLELLKSADQFEKDYSEKLPSNEQKDYRLNKAVKSRNLAELEKVLKENVATNTTNQNNETLLFKLLELEEDLPLATLLIVYGANLNHASKSNVTPLNLAISNNRLEIVRLLLEQGASPEKLGTCPSPLGLAISWGHFEIVKALLQKGANPTRNLPNAADTGQENMIKALIDGGADQTIVVSLNKIRPKRLLSLQLLKKTGCKIVDREISAEQTNTYEELSLLLKSNASSISHEKVLTLFTTLFKHYTDRNSLSTELESQLFGLQKTYLDLAPPQKEKAELQALLDATFTQEQQKQLRLENLVNSKDLDALDAFLKTEDLTVKNKFGETLLFQFLKDEHLSVVRKLIELGAEINLQNVNNFSPLSFAIKNNHPELVDLLLSLGAKTSFTNLEDSPLALAIRANNQRGVKALLNHMTNEEKSADYLLMAASNEPLLMLLLSHGVHREIHVSLSHFHGQLLTKLIHLKEKGCTIVDSTPSAKLTESLVSLRQILENDVKSLNHEQVLSLFTELWTGYNDKFKLDTHLEDAFNQLQDLYFQKKLSNELREAFILKKSEMIN